MVYILYIVLFVIFLTISISISSFFKKNIYWNNNLLNAVLLYVIPFNIKMRNIKQINIKNCTYCFFDDMINIKDFDSNLLKIDKKSYQNIGIYYIGYITIKKLMIILKI